MNSTGSFEYHRVIGEICQLCWKALTAEDMEDAAWAYYYFSIQFRENLKVARSLYQHDDKLQRLELEECDTDNLSPWPGIAKLGEKMNHDEYMRRTLALAYPEPQKACYFAAIGQAYLRGIQKLDPLSRALSIASYEDGGLERVFIAILTFRRWDSALLRAFEHFLLEHVRFDSDPNQGHGALSRHLSPDDRVLPLWQAFRDILVTCVPRLLPDRGHVMHHGTADVELMDSDLPSSGAIAAAGNQISSSGLWVVDEAQRKQGT